MNYGTPNEKFDLGTSLDAERFIPKDTRIKIREELPELRFSNMTTTTNAFSDPLDEFLDHEQLAPDQVAKVCEMMARAIDPLEAEALFEMNRAAGRTDGYTVGVLKEIREKRAREQMRKLILSEDVFADYIINGKTIVRMDF